MNVPSVALATGTVITTIASLITLLILVTKTANSALYAIENNASSGSGDNNDDANNDDDNHWYDRENFDLKREDWAALKLYANALVLCAVCASMFVPVVRIWHPTKGSGLGEFNVGGLAASAFLVGCIMFVSFWHSANFYVGEDEDENGNNNNNNGDDDAYEMDEEELLAYHQKLVSTSSLVLAFVFWALSICIYTVGRKLPQTTGRQYDNNKVSDDDERSTASASTYAGAKSAAHVELFSEMWKWISSCTIVVFSLLLVGSCIASLGEDGERRQEEANGNAIMVLPWMILLAAGLSILGHRILGESRAGGAFGVGALSSGTTYYALLLLVTCVLYFDVEMRREDGAGLVLSFACFFLSWMYLAFSRGMYRFRGSFLVGGIVGDNSAGLGESTRSAGDFRRMDDDRSEMESVMELT